MAFCSNDYLCDVVSEIVLFCYVFIIFIVFYFCLLKHSAGLSFSSTICNACSRGILLYILLTSNDIIILLLVLLFILSWMSKSSVVCMVMSCIY